MAILQPSDIVRNMEIWQPLNIFITYNEQQGGWHVHGVGVMICSSFFLNSSCQPTETNLKGETTFHATALLVVWVKIPMEILMRTRGEDTQAKGKPRDW